MIRGEKVVLRALEQTDLETLHRWMNDAEVVHFLGRRFPISALEEQRWLEREHDPTKELVLGIAVPEGRLIGSCGLHQINPCNHNAHVGIMIGEKEYWGQGYGTDALVTLCAFGFAEMNLHRVCLHVFDFNPRGIRCYEKVGFVQEGRMREAIYKHGAYQDILEMGLLREEFRAKWPQRWPGTGT
ncbi:MAG: GNAT family N-acetyltransferase [Armatimonadetes bacterium]|nr:GNAT family N-acetyltransferase [Armatimonadota bacterium]